MPWRSLQKLDTPTRVALRLGAYQLTRSVPAHAAVGETVAIAPRKARGYVNAVLRAVAGVGPNWPWPGGESVAALAVRLSYPDWIVEALVAGAVHPPDALSYHAYAAFDNGASDRDRGT